MATVAAIPDNPSRNLTPEQVFVGRGRELAQLQTFLEQALAGQARVVLVSGEAGSGKTALLREFGRRAQQADAGLAVAMGNCNAQTGLGDPYLPFRELLRLLTGDVEAELANNTVNAENATRLRGLLVRSTQTLVEVAPDLVNLFLAGIPGAGLVARVGSVLAKKSGWLDSLDKLVKRPPPTPGDTPLDQNRIFEQYTRALQALAGQRPLLLVLDDLQWADAASISLLFHLGRQMGASRMLILGAYRPDEVALGHGGQPHPLEKVLTEFKRQFGDIWVRLDQPEEAEGRHFIDAFLDTEPNQLGDSFRQALFRHTEGHPLFVIELLRDMQERGDIVRDAQGRWVEGPALRWETLPARVEGVTEERINRLDQDLRDILSVASVEGEAFTVQVIAGVQEMQERQLLRKLSQELEKRHGLVHEKAEVKVGRQILSRYQFGHALFQQYLYHELSAGERRLLHRQIAQLLEELYQDQKGEITVQLARHYSEAGEGEQAIGYLLQAGDKARGLYAYPEAIAYYEKALEFLRERREYQRAARTLMKLGLTYHIAFDFPRARQAYEEGFALWQQAGELKLDAALPAAPHAFRTVWSEPQTLDPGLAIETNSILLLDQLFRGLVERNAEMDIIPDLARSWEVHEDGRTYVFDLRDDVRWSDGLPVTAADLEYAWKRVLHPATASEAAGMLYDIKGARAFHLGEVLDPDQVGVRALDRARLLVELEGPTSYFLHLLANHVASPVPRHIIEAHGAAWTDAEHIVTNGPFRLLEWQKGRHLVLVRDPAYRGRFTGNVQRVEMTFADWLPGLTMYERDELDMLRLRVPDLSEQDRARQRHPEEYVSVPMLSTYAVSLDVSRPPFDDIRVRRAFALAANREKLANTISKGFPFPAEGGFIPSGMPGYSAGIALPFDPEQARRLLAEAGYPGGHGFPALEALSSRLSSTTDYLAAQWREHLGVEVRWQAASYEEVAYLLSKQPPHLLADGWLAEYPDPDDLLRLARQRCLANWRNETYDSLVEEARRATDQRLRMKLYQQADRILIEEAVILPISYSRLHLLLKPWVTRFPMSAIRYWFFKDVVIEPHS